MLSVTTLSTLQQPLTFIFIRFYVDQPRPLSVLSNDKQFKLKKQSIRVVLRRDMNLGLHDARHRVRHWTITVPFIFIVGHV